MASKPAENARMNGPLPRLTPVLHGAGRGGILLTLCVLLAGATEPVPQAPADEALPEVVARVGDRVITGAEFKRDLEFRWRRIELLQGRPITVDGAFRLDTLNALINGQILQILAENSGIAIPDEAVQAEFAKRRATIPTEEAFQAYLKRMGLTRERLLEEIRTRLLTEAYVDRETPGIQVSEEDIREEYRRAVKDGRMTRPSETVDVAQILVHVPPGPPESWAEGRKRIEDARNRVLAGEDFREVAREVSDDPASKERGGLLLESVPGQMPQVVVQQMEGLPLGQLSEPFKSAAGWHIIKILSRNPEGVIPFEKVRGLIRDQLLEGRRNLVLNRLVDNARILIPVEIYRASVAEVAPADAGTTKQRTEAE